MRSWWVRLKHDTPVNPWREDPEIPPFANNIPIFYHAWPRVARGLSSFWRVSRSCSQESTEGYARNPMIGSIGNVWSKACFPGNDNNFCIAQLCIPHAYMLCSLWSKGPQCDPKPHAPPLRSRSQTASHGTVGSPPAPALPGHLHVFPSDTAEACTRANAPLVKARARLEQGRQASGHINPETIATGLTELFAWIFLSKTRYP